MSSCSSIQEAANKLKQAEQDVRQARTDLAILFKQEVSIGVSVTELSRQTDIKRPRIYWLIQNLKDDRNE